MDKKTKKRNENVANISIFVILSALAIYLIGFRHRDSFKNMTLEAAMLFMGGLCILAFPFAWAMLYLNNIKAPGKKIRKWIKIRRITFLCMFIGLIVMGIGMMAIWKIVSLKYLVKLELIFGFMMFGLCLTVGSAVTYALSDAYLTPIERDMRKGNKPEKQAEKTGGNLNGEDSRLS